MDELPSCGTCINEKCRDYDILFCGIDGSEIDAINWVLKAKDCEHYKHR